MSWEDKPHQRKVIPNSTDSGFDEKKEAVTKTSSGESCDDLEIRFDFEQTNRNSSASPFTFTGFLPSNKDQLDSATLGDAILHGSDIFTVKNEQYNSIPQLLAQKLTLPQNPAMPVELLCGLCRRVYNEPKVLACFHSFCARCLRGAETGSIQCPACGGVTRLDPELGVEQLITDSALVNLIDGHNRRATRHRERSTKSDDFYQMSPEISSSDNDEDDVAAVKKLKFCSICTSNMPLGVLPHPGALAITRCATCSVHLCSRCKKAHFSSDAYIGHKVEALDKERVKVTCTQHGEPLVHFCQTCNVAMCHQCRDADHSDVNAHVTINDLTADYFDELLGYAHLAQHKEERVLKLRAAAMEFENSIEMTHQQAIDAIERDARRLVEFIDRERQRKLDLLSENKKRALMDVRSLRHRLECFAPKLRHTTDFTERLLSHSAPCQAAVFKSLLEQRYQAILKCQIPDTPLHYASTLNFHPNSDAEIRRLMTAAFGQVGLDSLHEMGQYPLHQTLVEVINTDKIIKSRLPDCKDQPDPVTYEHLVDSILSMPRDDGAMRQPAIRFGSYTDDAQLPPNANNDEPLSQSLLTNGGSTNGGGGMMPKAPHVTRMKMIYHLRFGEYGSEDGKFTEPSGVAVGNSHNNRLVYVADTNNHRIQAFERDGRFKFSFGECGKRDGQLLYPNRVTVSPVSGEIVVTERAPTHQIQVYSPQGAFIRKFGAYVLQHPRGVCIDDHQRIIVVECKVMRILIFSMEGQVLKKICCRPHLEFPNGVCTNDKEEIFVSDNRAHCVKVFNYDGALLRCIGGEGITNYPIGVGINSLGEVVIADNHNNFNVTTFSQDGRLLAAFESKLKHAQCFDVALTDEGSVVLASKDFKVYLYRYDSTEHPQFDEPPDDARRNINHRQMMRFSDGFVPHHHSGGAAYGSFHMPQHTPPQFNMCHTDLTMSREGDFDLNQMMFEGQSPYQSTNTPPDPAQSYNEMRQLFNRSGRYSGMGQY